MRHVKGENLRGRKVKRNLFFLFLSYNSYINHPTYLMVSTTVRIQREFFCVCGRRRYLPRDVQVLLLNSTQVSFLTMLRGPYRISRNQTSVCYIKGQQPTCCTIFLTSTRGWFYSILGNGTSESPTWKWVRVIHQYQYQELKLNLRFTCIQV